MGEVLYSEMTDRELLTHVARNTDQLVGFALGLTSSRLRCLSVTIEDGLIIQCGQPFNHAERQHSNFGYTWNGNELPRYF